MFILQSFKGKQPKLHFGLVAMFSFISEFSTPQQKYVRTWQDFILGSSLKKIRGSIWISYKVHKSIETAFIVDNKTISFRSLTTILGIYQEMYLVSGGGVFVDINCETTELTYLLQRFVGATLEVQYA